MIIIPWMNINAVDLNLLKVFAALYGERHVTRAGALIGLAQPSMSNALARLRALFDDALFVRTPGGMVPTERAEALAPQIDAALGLMARALVAPERFDPLTAEAEIALASSDNIVLTHGPAIIRHFQTVAPGFDLRMRTLTKDTLWADLDSGATDIAIGTFAQIPARFHRRDWSDDAFVCIARNGHPALCDGLTLEVFATLAHILTTLNRDSTGAVDAALARMGKSRRIALTVTQFAVVPDVVAQTDCIATIPRSVAGRLAGRSGCTIHELPLTIPAWTTQILWSATAHSDPARRFAVSEFARLRAGF